MDTKSEFIKRTMSMQATIDKAEQVEAKAGGKTLTPGLKNAVAQINANTSIGFTRDQVPMVKICFTTLEPAADRGVSGSIIHYLADDDPGRAKPRSLQQKLEMLFSDFKLIGLNTASKDIAGIVDKMLKDKPKFIFNTSLQTNDRGWPWVNIQKPYEANGEPAAETESAPAPAKKRRKKRQSEPSTAPQQAEQQEATANKPLVAGDRVVVDSVPGDDDCPWTGVVKAMEDDDTVVVIYDGDGSEYRVDVQYLTLEDN
jgi:hypothetical protein